MADLQFERALQALLDGTPLPTGDDGPVEAASIEDLRIVDAIARVYRVALFGTDVAPDRPVASLWGHLEVRGEIGRGASGSVYRAWDTRLAREVALKLFASDAAPIHAIDEGRLLARLNHPNIVRVFGADTHDGIAGIWMELLEGDTLDDVLARDGVFGGDEALLIGLDLARALSSVHAAGLLHRDIKARNVLRERGGRIVLMDLGAGRAQQETPGFDATGTPMYMAPEVLAGGSASVRSDVYSLGVLLYRLVTGEYPVTGAGLDALRTAHQQRSRQALVSRRPDLHPAVAAAVERCCSPLADDRPATAGEVETMLTAALQDLLDAQLPVRTPLARWGRRWRNVAVVATAMVVAFSGLVWTVWDTDVVRQTRRNLGLGVGPRSTLYLTINGGLAMVRGLRVSTVGSNPGTAMAIAASADSGVRTFAGLPPWTLGAAFTLDGEPAPNPPGPNPDMCCFYDGTTDGRFNYAARNDSTLLAPIGSRPLAPPAIYQFDRDWSNPRMLLPLSRVGYYSGIAYAGRSDTFWLIRHESGDSILEEWPRAGSEPVRSVSIAAENLTGVAVDPRDGTLWAVNEQATVQSIRLENFDGNGRRLGTLILNRALPNSLGSESGAEFAWIPQQ